MSSLAKELNSEQIIAALNYIDEHQPSLNWSKWKLHHQGKQYPPKEVVRIAARLAEIPNWEEKRLTGGPNTNEPLQALGFQINASPSNDPLQELLDRYKTQLQTQEGLGGERYKWELIAKYMGRPRLDEENLFQEIKEIAYSNLIYGTAIAVIHHLARDQQEGYRSALKDLFGSEISLDKRIDAFIEAVSQLYTAISPKSEFSHFHDERTIASVLTFHDPDNYALYKHSFYSKLCKLIGIKQAPKNRKYIHYLELINSLIEDYLIPDNDLIDLYRGCLTDDLYQDPNLKLLAQDILYRSLDQQIGQNRAYWRVGTSDEEGNHWDQMLRTGVVGIGWPDLGDLDAANLSSKADVWELLKETGYYTDPKQKGTHTRKAGEIFNFLSAIKIGDVIVGQDGKNIHGIGVVTSDYEYRPSMHFPHTRKVDWIQGDIGFVNKDGLQTSVWEISDLNTIKNVDRFLSEGDQPDTDSFKQDEMSIPLNQILFGPPGTGKTYNTINKALEIINDEDVKNLEFKDRAAVKALFDKKMVEGQIVFTTFHQSMSYEGFVEGIKPDIEEDDDGKRSVVYDVKDGIFKRLCKQAVSEYYRFKEKRNENSPLDRLAVFEDAWNNLVELTQSHIDASKPLHLETLTEKKLTAVSITNQGNLIIRPQVKDAQEYTVSFNRAKKLFDSFPDLKIVRNIDKEFRAVIGGSNSTAYWSVINYLNQWVDKYGHGAKHEERTAVDEKLITFDQDLVRQHIKKEVAPYVLIIDEINRGNVSQIFGELITLIEESKRLGKDDALSVTLPYSKDTFGVPPNLYIIGTMNTADRSVEALDAALRRRFSFTEMLPNPQSIATHGALKEVHGFLEGVNLVELLRTINLRIEKLVDRDHQIGHSYFLPVEDWESLRQAFYKCLIPLLQEYFFGDYGKIALVLGNGFVREKDNSKSGIAFFADVPEGYEDLADRKVYEIKVYNADKIDGFKEAVRNIKIIAGANE